MPKLTNEENKVVYVGNRMYVDKNFLTTEWDLPYGGNPDLGVEIILDEISHQSRWETFNHLTIKIDDRFWQTTYGYGSTECQDSAPWEWEKEVEFIEVHQVEKLVKVWEIKCS